MAEGTGRGEMLSIWFFVGIMTLAYGVVLLPYGAWEWWTNHPPRRAKPPFLRTSTQPSGGAC